MSSAELGISVAKMIRAGKVKGISCTGANLEEDIFNLVVRVHLYSGRCCCGQALISAYSIVGIVQAHTSYERVPAWRHLSEQQEEELYNTGRNRVTDTSSPSATYVGSHHHGSTSRRGSGLGFRFRQLVLQLEHLAFETRHLVSQVGVLFAQRPCFISQVVDLFLIMLALLLVLLREPLPVLFCCLGLTGRGSRL